jgi:dipeptidyl aminopeptidase/acylaminoacyl peptidase
VRAKLSTVAVVAVVGGVAAAALIDSLNGHSGSPSPAPAQAVTGSTASGQGQTHGEIVSGLVDVGIRSHRPGGTRIQVIAERLRFGPGIGSPSGERIAMWAWNPARPDLDGIYTRDAAGGALERITTAPAGRMQTPLAYSAGGTSILFAQEGPDHGAGALYIVRADATHRVRLTPPGMTSGCCDLGHPEALGPDGRVAFAAFAAGAAGRGGTSALYLADADGSRVRRITPEGARIATVRWSADGRWITFDRVDGPAGAHDLLRVRPDGTGLHVTAPADGAASS